MPPEPSREDVLEVDQTPDDQHVHLMCMAAEPVQLIEKTRQPMPAEVGQPERYDYEYARNGTATLFMCTEPLRGGRLVRVREHKTAVDWATEVPQLLDTQDPEAERIRLVCENLHTHGIGSLSEAFPPEPARG